MPFHAAFNRLGGPLLVMAGCITLPFPGTSAQSFGGTASFNVQIVLSQKAASKLTALSEGIIVAATWSGDPAAGAARRTNPVGQIDLGQESEEVPARSQTVHVSGAPFRRDRLSDVHGAVMLNVNVYSARHTGPDNILNCDSFDGTLQEAIHKPLVLHCSLITEKKESSGLAGIPPDRAADSYAIYSLLLPGAPLATITPEPNQSWSMADATVNIGDMNPAIPPDGQLKAPPDNVKAFNEALQDYQARKDQRFRLEAPDFHMNRSYDLLNGQQVSDLRRSSPAGTGVAFFSAVFFNSAQTAALVYVNDWCANLCAVGQWVYLEKHNGQWIRRSGLIAKGA
ncbi:MAG: hypothetical protein WA826_07870 [Silvibacterium sp.]